MARVSIDFASVEPKDSDISEVLSVQKEKIKKILFRCWDNVDVEFNKDKIDNVYKLIEEYVVDDGCKFLYSVVSNCIYD